LLRLVRGYESALQPQDLAPDVGKARLPDGIEFPMRRECGFDHGFALGLCGHFLQGSCLQEREVGAEIRNDFADCVEHGLLEISAPQLIEEFGDVCELAGDGSGKPVDLVNVVRSQKSRSDADNEFCPDRELAGGERRRQRFLGDSLKRLANLEEGIKSDPRGDDDEQCDRTEGELKPAFQAEPDPFLRDGCLLAGPVARIRD
jgi:hypothetical protein